MRLSQARFDVVAGQERACHWAGSLAAVPDSRQRSPALTPADWQARVPSAGAIRVRLWPHQDPSGEAAEARV
jgi:hypothetical protein